TARRSRNPPEGGPGIRPPGGNLRPLGRRGCQNLNYTVRGQDPDGSLVVEYTLKNNTSNASFLHYIGYYDWLEKTNREEGVFSSVDQKIIWTERIPAKEK
ncbi:hypothetical protein AB0A81_33530, partial [Streptomyces flaveolus]